MRNSATVSYLCYHRQIGRETTAVLLTPPRTGRYYYEQIADFMVDKFSLVWIIYRNAPARQYFQARMGDQRSGCLR